MSLLRERIISLLIERAVVKVGMEIEVAAWKGRRDWRTVVGELLDAEYMVDDGRDWAEMHQYHCNCNAGCQPVRSGIPVYPKPLVSATYDASLPNDGAEFITSTIVIDDEGLADLKPIWDIVVKGADWRNDLPNRREDDLCSPSVHLHVSATTPEYLAGGSPINPDAAGQYMADVGHALSLYAPELFALAGTANVKRGVHFRMPARGRGHHDFIHVRSASPNESVYIEWRLFEADYESWEYIESCAFVAATLTRALLDSHAFATLMSAGYESPPDRDALADAVDNDDVDMIIDLVDQNRFNVLQRLCLNSLDDDQYGFRLLESLFNSIGGS